MTGKSFYLSPSPPLAPPPPCLVICFSFSFYPFLSSFSYIATQHFCFYSWSCNFLHYSKFSFCFVFHLLIRISYFIYSCCVCLFVCLIGWLAIWFSPSFFFIHIVLLFSPILHYHYHHHHYHHHHHRLLHHLLPLLFTLLSYSHNTNERLVKECRILRQVVSLHTSPHTFYYVLLLFWAS